MRIQKLNSKTALVDFLDKTGAPVSRPYMNSAPAEQMTAHYDDYNGEFDVELWKREKGFTLHLAYEYEYELDELRSESLVPSISRYSEDEFLDDFYP